MKTYEKPELLATTGEKRGARDDPRFQYINRDYYLLTLQVGRRSSCALEENMKMGKQK